MIVAIAFAALWSPFISPSIQYYKALDLAESKQYSKAIEILQELDGFKDSEEKIEEMKKEKEALDEWAKEQAMKEWENYLLNR